MPITFLNSIESIIPIVVLILTGYLMARAGWINEGFGNSLSKFIVNVSLPCYMIWNLTDTFDRDKFFSMLGGTAIPIISIGAAYLIAVLTSCVLKVPQSRKGIFRSIFFCSNTIFVGLPVNLALFGPSSVPYVLLYYAVNTTYFWTLGNYEISSGGMAAKSASLFSVPALKRILSPALLGFILGVILIMLKIKLPDYAISSLKYLGTPTTPLALIFIGLAITTIRISDFKIDREILALLCGRFVISPLIVILLMHMIHIPALMGKVFVIQSAMPAMTNTSIIAKSYGADYKFASVATVITTLACIIAIPVLMTIL